MFKAASGTAEKIQQITPKATPDEIFIGERQEAADGTKPLKILFIGNSMTFYWAIPESLQAMLEIGTRDLRIESHRSLYGGKGLEYHYNETDALDRIKTGNFDIVVLQASFDEHLSYPEQMTEYVEKFDLAIRASGAKTLFYARPGYQKTTDAEWGKVIASFVELGEKIGASILPACETLRRCCADAGHMGMHGGYAVACTFYAALAGGAPFPTPAILAQQVEIDPDLAAFIQEKAKQAVATYYKPKH